MTLKGEDVTKLIDSNTIINNQHHAKVKIVQNENKMSCHLILNW